MQLQWRGGGAPFSEKYQDIYYDPEHPAQESQAIFIQQSQLRERWQDWNSSDEASVCSTAFHLCEIGVGTGLNLCLSLEHWLQAQEQKSSHPNCLLPSAFQYIGVEQRPLAKNELERAQVLWGDSVRPEIKSWWLEQSDRFRQGCTIVEYKNFQAIIYIGSLTEFIGNFAYPSRSLTVDQWSLDGFAPSKNPEMWTPELFQFMARHSRADSRVATFTAASGVRRGLQEVGFEVSKIPGFGRKREMIQAVFPAKGLQSQTKSTAKLDLRPYLNFGPAGDGIKNKEVTIIGAGVAGATLAFQLAKRGWSIRVIDQSDSIASGASGNPSGMIMPSLSEIPTEQAQLALAGVDQFFSQWQELQKLGIDVAGKKTGVLQVLGSALDSDRANGFLDWTKSRSDDYQFLSPAEASRICGIEIFERCLWLKKAAWINPQQWTQGLFTAAQEHCRRNGQDFSIELKYPVQFIKQEQGIWKISSKTTKWQSSHVALACSLGSKELIPGNWSLLKGIRGQISQVQLDELQVPVNAREYLVPSGTDGQAILGATFDRNSDESQWSPEAHQRLHQNIKQWMNTGSPTVQGGRVAWRCVGADPLPWIGPLPKYYQYLETYSDLQQGRHYQDYPWAPVYSNLWISSVYGSRGLTYSAIGAQILANLMESRPAPVCQSVLEAVFPARQISRQLKRQASGKHPADDGIKESTESRSFSH